MKLILVSLFALVNMSIAYAQTAPEIVVVTFQREYPKVFCTWEVEDVNYRVEYLDVENNTKRSILYDNAGNIIRRDWKMSTNYPMRISDYYHAAYPGELFEVWSSISESGCQSYYIIRQNTMIWFDRNGKRRNSTV